MRKATLILSCIAAITAGVAHGQSSEPLMMYPFSNDGRPAMPGRPEMTLGGGSFVPGPCGQALHLDGRSVLTALAPESMPRLGGQDAQGEFSLTFVFRPGPKRSYQIVMAQSSVGPNDRIWWIGYAPSAKRLDFLLRDPDNKGQAQVFSIPTVNAGEWYFVAASVSKGMLKLSVTPLQAAHPGTILPTVPAAGVRQAESALTLGGRQGEAAAAMFEGDIDELAFWGRALTLAELDALFRHHKAGQSFGGAFDLAEAAKKSRLTEQPLPFFPPAPAEHFRAGPERLQNSGPGKHEFVAPIQLASGDFSVELELLAPALERSRFQIDLGADGFLFDGEKGVVRNVGNSGTSTFKNKPLHHSFRNKIATGNPFRFGLTLNRGILVVSLDGREIYRNFLDRDTYGEVAVTALQGEILMRKIELRGAFLRQAYSEVFSSGEAGTAFYRIPAIVRAKDGTLLVFAEARKTDFHDLGNIDMVLRRSVDGGKSWLPIQTLHDGGGDGPISCVNPGPILEPDTGRLHLLFHLVEKSKWGSGNYKLLHTWSDDNGMSWTSPVDVKAPLPAEWLSFQPGPGHGIVKQSGAHRGRLIMPGWYVYREGNERRFASALIYSDDRGQTWTAGGTGMNLADECMVAEREDGSIVMAIRPPLGIPKSEFRHFSVSRDGGTTFEPFTVDLQLRAPVCQSSLLSTQAGKSLYFLYPAGGSYAPGASTRRAGLTLRRQLPGGGWSSPRLIHAGRSGYSDLTQMADDRLGIVFEGGRKSDIGGIRFASVEIPQTADTVLRATSVADEQMIEKTDLFQSGQLGYRLFHIPGLVVTAKGTVLAWCEARREAKSDWDSIDILLRRSTDGGKTWDGPRRVADIPGPKHKNPVTQGWKNVDESQVTYNNPVFIADRDGSVHFVFCYEYMKVFYSRSDDDGLTWSTPRDITATAERFRSVYDWKVFATGPNHGIQLRDNGRLVIPVWLSLEGGFPSVSSTIYSDDRGMTWHAGEIAVPHTEEWRFPNETTAVELADGRVMLNVRSESPKRRRIVTVSQDGATGWSTPRFDEALLEPACMASIVRYSYADDAARGGRNRLLFSNPDNLDGSLDKEHRFRERKNLSIKLSYDEGSTWAVNRVLEPGGSGYSDLAVAEDGTILCFYGRGDRRDHGGYAFKYLTLARFNLQWLSGGNDK